jgi:hypothetical protein
MRAPCGSRGASSKGCSISRRHPNGAFHLQRTRFELIGERKLRRRQLTETGDVEIIGRDLREKTQPIGQGSLFATVAT